jgi:dienelactone hydrolase
MGSTVYARNFINLTAADDFEFPAYVAQPAGTPKGGVVVLQEIFGVNAHIRAVADSYAAEGYLAIAPSTFHLLPGRCKMCKPPSTRRPRQVKWRWWVIAGAAC